MKEFNNIYSEDEIYKFNGFLNKVISLSAKEFFRKELKNQRKELKILDGEDLEIGFKDIFQNEEYFFEQKSITNVFEFISCCENLKLYNALKSLTAIEQSVIFLLFNEELSQEEASKILKICSKSVSRIKVRAFKKLKDYMNKGEL